MDEVSGMNHHWEIEIIPNDDFVYRQVHHQATAPKGKRVPSEAAFILGKGEQGLSVNWDKYMNVKDNYILIGSSYTKKNDFIDYTAFLIFRLKVEFIRSMNVIKDVLHDPVFSDHPPKGKPNNQAHSLILYDEDDSEEVRMNLADYCTMNFDNSYCKFDVRSIKNEIDDLRRRLDG